MASLTNEPSYIEQMCKVLDLNPDYVHSISIASQHDDIQLFVDVRYVVEVSKYKSLAESIKDSMT